ncbi:MAG: sigma-70 family RNA polymerase sigma factor [Planctomycetes bacterium]|nr:sigma-70 family RNA polymerase sigma factor [Planctomycetota bacterium]
MSSSPEEECSLEAAVQRVREGDREAVGELMDSWRADLVRFVERRAGPALLGVESREDIVQSACREVLRGVDGAKIVDGAEGFKAWLFRATLNKIIDRRRFWDADKRDRKRRVDVQWSDASIDELKARITGPDRAAERNELSDRIRDMLALLPARYEEVLRLAHFDGLSRAEIAMRLDRTEMSVRSLLARAMARLTRLMHQHFGDCPRDESSRE